MLFRLTCSGTLSSPEQHHGFIMFNLFCSGTTPWIYNVQSDLFRFLPEQSEIDVVPSNLFRNIIKFGTAPGIYIIQSALFRNNTNDFCCSWFAPEQHQVVNFVQSALFRNNIN
jgi:hypothetical protein